MPLDVPLLKVSRPIAACQRCRSAKIKCDGKLPACTACEKSGRSKQCSSGNSQFAPGKERSYVSTLEARVDKLERSINAARERRQSSSKQGEFMSLIMPLSRSSTLESLNRPDHGSINRKARFRKELGTVDELVADFGFLTVNATARDYQYGFTNAISYARLIIAAASKEPLPSGMKKDLPSRATALPLVKLYIDNCLALYPIFTEQEIYRSLDALTGHDQSNATSMDAWTIGMIVGISSASRCRQRGDAMYTDAIGHVCKALEVADQVLHPGSIWSIQAMLLLVQFSMLDATHFDSWTLIGAASRAMIDLGLHQDPPRSSKIAKQKLDLRRRVYHSVYCLDRVTSIVQTRSFSFSDDSANVALPFSLKKVSPLSPTIGHNDNVWTRSNEVARCFLEWRRLQSQWYTDLYQSGRTPWTQPHQRIGQIYHQMEQWFENLPSSTPSRIRDFLELDLLYSYICVLAPNHRCPHPSEHAQRLLLEHASTYVERVKQYQTEPLSISAATPFTFYDALRAYSIGRELINTLSINLDVLLQPLQTHSGDRSSGGDAQAADSPSQTLGVMSHLPLTPRGSQDQVHFAAHYIKIIENFDTILSAFGDRFGSISEVCWKDRFKNSAQPLLAQLYFQSSRHGSTGSNSSYLRPTAQQTSVMSHGILDVSLTMSRPPASFYPSPATTSHSPGFVQHDEKSTNTMSHTAKNHSEVGGMNHFGLGNTAAWETLPGGSRNVRYL